MNVKLVLLFFTAALVKVTSCQWVLDIFLFDFQITRNIEMRNDDGNTEYCCCDTYDCETSAGNSNLDTCPQTCDIFFIVELSNCQDSNQCYISTSSEHITNTPALSSYGYIFTFALGSVLENLSLKIEIRDDSTISSMGEVMDTFDVVVNPSIDQKHQLIDGNEGVAMISFGYQVTCIDIIVCGTTQNTPLVESSCTPWPATETLVITTTSILSVPCTDILTKTVIVTQSPDNFVLNQSSEAEGLQTVWMVVAILLLVIVLSAISFIVILGYILHKKVKMLKKSDAMPFNNELNKSVREGGLDNPVYSPSSGGRNEPINATNACYATVDNELYGNGGEPDNAYYECGPKQLQQSNKYQQPPEPRVHKAHDYETPLPSLKREKKE